MTDLVGQTNNRRARRKFAVQFTGLGLGWVASRGAARCRFCASCSPESGEIQLVPGEPAAGTVREISLAPHTFAYGHTRIHTHAAHTKPSNTHAQGAGVVWQGP